MLESKTVFSQIEVVENGIVQIRFEKQVVDGDKVLTREYHRTAIQPGESLDAQMTAVAKHLSAMGYPAPDADVVERVRKIVGVEHTPDRVAKFKEARERAERGNSQR